MIQRYLYYIIGLLLSVHSAVYAMFPINITRPYDYNVYPRYTHNAITKFEMNMFAEFGLKANASICDSCSPFQLWQCDNDALAMIKGFSTASCDPVEQELADFAQNFIGIDDTNKRGHVLINGNLDLDYNVILAARYHFPYDVTLGLYIPFLAFRTCNISIEDLTPAHTPEDLFVKELLTNNLSGVVDQFGRGLHIGPWQEQGIGDIAVIASWTPDFPQRKPILRNVRLHVDLGFSIPTAKQVNINNLLAIPLGNSGASGLFFGAGIDLRLGRYIRMGVDASFLNLFTHVGPSRFRTFGEQPDLLLLHKGQCVLKDWGFTQMYNIYGTLYKFFDRISARVMYQFMSHDEDTISLGCSDFSSFIANSAASLQGWTTHQFLFSLDYDADERMGLKPYFMWFYKLPVNGCRSILLHTTGVVFALRY